MFSRGWEREWFHIFKKCWIIISHCWKIKARVWGTFLRDTWNVIVRMGEPVSKWKSSHEPRLSLMAMSRHSKNQHSSPVRSSYLEHAKRKAIVPVYSAIKSFKNFNTKWWFQESGTEYKYFNSIKYILQYKININNINFIN